MPDITITITDAEYADIKESVWRTGSQYAVDLEGINSTDDVTASHIISATKAAVLNSVAQALIFKEMDNWR